MFNNEWYINTTEMGDTSVIICIVTALLLGIVVSLAYMFTTEIFTKNFAVTLALLPVIVQAVLVMVNGNLGTSVAVLGIFSLVRFRSVPGSSKEIMAVFLTTAIGLAVGMGFIGYAVVLAVIVGLAFILLAKLPFGVNMSKDKQLKVTIPENLDYTEIFDDIFDKYLKRVRRERVKSVNMGTMFEITYNVTFKDLKDEKKLIDEIRCRNGNLTVSCGRLAANVEEL